MKGRPTSSRTRFTVESARQKILAKLRRAGRRGVPRGQFGITTTTPYATVEVLESALDSLVSEGKIVQILTRPIPRFFTVEKAPDADRVAEKILDRAKKKSGRLLAITELENALSDVEKPLAEKTAASLVERVELVRLRYHAKDLYTHAESLRQDLGIVSTTSSNFERARFLASPLKGSNVQLPGPVKEPDKEKAPQPE